MRIDPLFALLSSSIAIVVVIGMRLLLRKYVSAKWLSLLWLPVAWMLLFPVRLQSPLSIYQPVQHIIYRTQSERLEVPLIQEQSDLFTEEEIVHPVFDLQQVGYLIWVTGSFIMLLYYASMEYRLAQKIGKNHIVDSELEKRVRIITKGELPVLISDAVSNCMLFQNRIFLNSKLTMLEDEDLHMVLCHEMAHYHRYHHWVLQIMKFIAGLYFFHPLIYLMKHLVDLDLDEIADHDVGLQYNRVQYCELLLKLGTEVSSAGVPAIKKQIGVKAMKQRFLAILNEKRMKLWMKLGMGLCIVFLVALFVQPQQAISKVTYLVPVETKSTRNVSFSSSSEAVQIVVSGNKEDIAAIVEQELVAMVDLDRLELMMDSQMTDADVQYGSDHLDRSVLERVSIEADPIEITQLSEYEEEEPLIVDLSAVKPIKYIYPIDNPEITCRYECYAGHKAVDIRNKEKDYAPVYAIADGVVIANLYNSVNGYHIRIEHDQSTVSGYNHFKEASPLAVGAAVKQGDIIGISGQSGVATGPHVHLVLEKDGKRVNPLAYLGK